ncbi:unnamed protein product [Caenorhabditis angaria]|uniref:Uncharacterized protein n=1 Tax=Caenorhabditis angaria TaxID=860376 RepID=A0A9P1N6E6_9PELO|nr:unnamed protein product [Caenorhabditis angaria]
MLSRLNVYKNITRRNSSIFQRVKSFLVPNETENFDVEEVKRCHNWDKLDEKEWTLIYRDIGASRTNVMTGLFLPCFIAGSAIFLYDIQKNEANNRFDFVQRIVNDAEELGNLIFVPTIALSLVIALLVRVQQLRVMRIYQNRKNVEDFIAIRSKYIVRQQKFLFNRDSSSAFYFAEEQSDGRRVALNFLFGNIQIGNQRQMIMDDMFRANNYRSFMLNETSVPPRL